MDIQEIQKEREILASKIHSLLVEFTSKTHTTVRSIDYRLQTESLIGVHNREYWYGPVELEIRL